MTSVGYHKRMQPLPDGLRIERAKVELFDNLHRELLLPYFNNPAITREMWRWMLAPPWAHGEEYGGYALMHGEAVVGFIGAVFADVRANGRTEPFANICVWVVHRAYRRHSLNVLYAIEELKDRTLTVHSAIPVTFRALTNIGFQVLDSTQFVGVYRRQWAAWRRRAKGERDGVTPRAITDLEAIAALLHPNDRRVLEDHRPCPCRHVLLIDEGGRQCYVMFNVALRELPRSEFLTLSERMLLRLRARLGHDPYRVNQVLFISDPDSFVRYFEDVVTALYGATGVRLTVVDKRMVGHRPLDGVEVPLRPQKLYWPTTVPPEQIQNHYSELALFGI